MKCLNTRSLSIIAFLIELVIQCGSLSSNITVSWGLKMRIIFRTVSLKGNSFFIYINIIKIFFPVVISYCPLNTFRIRWFVVPYLSFIRRWISYIQIKFYICYFMMTICIERRTPDSVTRFGCDINFKSIQKGELFKIWVASFMIWQKPKAKP